LDPSFKLPPLALSPPFRLWQRRKSIGKVAFYKIAAGLHDAIADAPDESGHV